MDCMQAPSQQTSTQGNCTVVARVCGHELMLCTSLSLGSPPTGTLPPEWGYPKEGHESQYPSAFPSLARLAIEGNNISGAAKNSAAWTELCNPQPGLRHQAMPAPRGRTGCRAPRRALMASPYPVHSHTHPVPPPCRAF